MTWAGLEKSTKQRAVRLKGCAVAEVELVYKAQRDPLSEPSIGSARDAYEVLLAAWDENKIDMVEQLQVQLVKGNRRYGLVLAFLSMLKPAPGKAFGCRYSLIRPYGLFGSICWFVSGQIIGHRNFPVISYTMFF